MTYFLSLFAVIFTLALLRNVLFWVSYIQRKQYRLDRLWHALNDVSFWRQFWSKARLLAVVMFFAFQIGVRVYQSAWAFDVLFYAALALFALDAGIGAAHAVKGKLEQPAWTPKTIGLTVLAFAVTTIIVRLPWVGTTALWRFDIVLPETALLVSIILPFIVLTVFSAVFLPNWILLRLMVRRAAQKRNSLTHVQAIGITGSVGKTTMKEFVAHLLAAKYHVLKTPAHINVDTGVARQVLNELTDAYDYYVVEMGAYRTGEIASICRLVRPAYAVLTALGNQHLELFGSHEKLRDAKFELADAVTDDARLFANKESPRLVQACQHKNRKPVWFGLPENVQMTEEGIDFSIEGQDYRIPGFGTARLLNASGAIAVAKAVGIEPALIAKQAASLPQTEHSMQLRPGKNGSLVIDCTYNASTDSVLQAIADLAKIPRSNRIIVFKDIIELGPDATADHDRVAKALQESRAHLMLLPSPWQERMQRGFTNPLMPPVDQQTVILCLGRETQATMNTFLSL